MKQGITMPKASITKILGHIANITEKFLSLCHSAMILTVPGVTFFFGPEYYTQKGINISTVANLQHNMLCM